MKLTKQKSLCATLWLGTSLACMVLSGTTRAQGFTTTTVQGTVYLANGHPGSGSLQVSWPTFTTANNQAVAAGRMNVTIGADGYVSVNLAANLGATPAGLYYTAVYHLSDGTTSTEYWVVPAAAQASLSQVRAQVMPAAQAVQAVSKAYVDQSVQELTQSLLTASGGSLSGPLFLNGDPLQPTQAASKHYVDTEFGMAVPMSGGALTGPLTSVQLGAAYQVDQFPGADFGAKLQACVNILNATYGGTCDGRNFTGNLVLSASLIIATANATVQLPCATISTSNQIKISAGTRNVTLHGCALRGASASSGSAGGTVFLYSGTGAMMQVGDPTYGVDTSGFHIDNAVINTTGSSSSTAEGLAARRTQEMNLASLYFLGNSNQTGITLDGTGNYTGGTFQDVELGGFGTAVNAIGHQTVNAMTTDWLNASTFLRLHIDCPTNGGTPIAGTYGINLQQGDGNTFTGGDVEGCSTALHLGPNAQNNTIVGLRNENSTNQVVADAGSSYNNWITGGTMFTGQLTDNGTRNSFLDTFHRSFNGLNGDWYGSQQDATVTNHFRLGTGNGNERGLLNRYQTDSGYRWTTGFSDATAGEQFYQVLDELNNVYRLSIGQYNNGQSSSNNQTVINAAGSGAVVLNGSSNSGTGGIVFGSGGASAATVASINNAGNAQFNGTLQVGGPSIFTNSTTVKNQVDAEIDSFLWAGATANQKESYTYKDYTGASQWYMVKDASNNWALNSATGGLDSFKAYQSSNSGDTYINASNPTGHIRLNYETGSGAETDIYSGASSGLVAAFLGSTAIKFPGLAAASGHNCLQIDNSGYISNSGSACGTSQNGTVNTGNAGQVAYYTGNGNVIAGMNAVAVNVGGTGASSATQALQNLGAQPVLMGVASDGASGIAVTGNVAAPTTLSSVNKIISIIAPPYNAKCDGVTDDQTAIQAAFNAAYSTGASVQFPKGTCLTSTIVYKGQSFFGAGIGLTFIQGQPGQDVFQSPDNNSYTMLFGTSFHDLNIVVNTSINAAATAAGGNNTFPNRIAGMMFPLSAFTIPIVPGNAVFGVGSCASHGVSATATTTAVTFNCTSFPLTYAIGQLDPALVIGAPITINGAGAAGGTYTGTITGITSGCVSLAPCTIAVTPAIGTTVTNASGNMLNAQTPPWYIGNAGIALQCSNGFACQINAQGWNVYNVEFDQTPTTYQDASHCAGIFTQSAFYSSHFTGMVFNNLYGGFVEAAPNSGRVATADTSSFKDMDFKHAVLPFVLYNGNDRDFSNINFYSEWPLQAGPYFLSSNQSAAANTVWTIHGIYMEGNNSMSGEIMRFMSGPYNVTGANMFGGAAGVSWAEWNAYSSKWDGDFIVGVKVDGNLNDFRNTYMQPNNIVDNGQGNNFEGLSQSGTPFYQARRSNPGPKPIHPIVGTLDGSDIATGSMTTPYLNASDLKTFCADWALPNVPSNVAGTCVSDPAGTELPREYFHSTAATTILDLDNNGGAANAWAGPGASRLFGTSVPQAPATVYIMGRCVGAASCTGQFQAKDGTTSGVISTLNWTFTSSWTIQSVATDFTGTTYGDVFDFRVQSVVNTGTNYDLAWVAIEPVDKDEHTWLANNGLPVSSSVNLKVADTTGAGITTGPISATNLDMAVFDGTTGKIKDGGAPPAALLTTVPLPLQYYGDGNEGALSCPSGTCNIIPGSHYYTTCNVASGAILAAVVGANVPVGTPLVLHCSTSATIAGTVSYSINTGNATGINNGTAFYGGGSGGGGFGAANGAAGSGYLTGVGGGAAGTSGVSGGTGTATPVYVRQLLLDSLFPYSSTTGCGGPIGGTGGSSGGPGGRGGGCVIIVAPTINFTGTCDVSGANGGAGGASTGGGGGGGGGVCLFRSPSMTNSGTFTVTGGAAGAAGTGTSTAGGAGANGWSKVFTQ
jgi:hypothetical protein